LLGQGSSTGLHGRTLASFLHPFPIVASVGGRGYSSFFFFFFLQLSQCIYLFFLSRFIFYHFYIYLHVYSLFVPLLPHTHPQPPTSRQNLFCPLL
jgi:hypothetical protein